MRAPLPIQDVEQHIVNRFLLFRRHVHDGPLYTRSRAWDGDPVAPAKAYDREQVNNRYQGKSKATVDPFNAVPTYGNRFKPPQRSLPLLGQRPYS